PRLVEDPEAVGARLDEGSVQCGVPVHRCHLLPSSVLASSSTAGRGGRGFVGFRRRCCRESAHLVGIVLVRYKLCCSEWTPTARRDWPSRSRPRSATRWPRETCG